MTTIHIVTPEAPDSRDSITADLDKVFQNRRYTTHMRKHSNARDLPVGHDTVTGSYLDIPDAVVIDGTRDAEAALQAAQAYRPFVSRIIMLTRPAPTPAYLLRCAKAGVIAPVPVSANTDATVDMLAGFTVNALAAGNAGLVAISSGEDKNKLWFDGGSLDVKRGVLTGPKDKKKLTARQTLVMAALLRNPGTVLTHQQLFTMSEANEDAELELVKVHICRIRKALTFVGLNGGKKEDDMIGTVWGRGTVYNPNATRPKETPAEKTAVTGRAAMVLEPGTQVAA